MSNLVVPDSSENILLWGAGTQLFGNMRVNLYKNNYTPVAGSLFGDFVPADYNGSGEQIPLFDIPVTVAGKATITDSAIRTFQVNAAGSENTIYGYYVYRTADILTYGRLYWAERFDNPVVMKNVGDKILLTLVFTLFSQF